MTVVKNEETLKKLENFSDFPIVVHGTNSSAWEFIRKEGLNKMGRNCIRKFLTLIKKIFFLFKNFFFNKS